MYHGCDLLHTDDKPNWNTKYWRTDTLTPPHHHPPNKTTNKQTNKQTKKQITIIIKQHKEPKTTQVRLFLPGWDNSYVS